MSQPLTLQHSSCSSPCSKELLFSPVLYLERRLSLCPSIQTSKTCPKSKTSDGLEPTPSFYSGLKLHRNVWKAQIQVLLRPC